MARGRMISKSLGTSRKFAELALAAGILGEFAQLLYPLLISHADDFGRLSGDAFTVKFGVFPTSPRSENEFDAVLNAMNQVGLIQRYAVDDRETVVQIMQWDRHQSGLHKRTQSRFPEPDGFLETPGNSRNSEDTPSQEKRTEEKGTEQKRGADATDEDFARFWGAYPRKLAKSKAKAAFTKLNPSTHLLEVILDALDRQSHSQQWLKENGQFVPHAATWLNGRRWEDEEQPTHGSSPPPAEDVLYTCRLCGEEHLGPDRAICRKDFGAVYACRVCGQTHQGQNPMWCPAKNREAA